MPARRSLYQRTSPLIGRRLSTTTVTVLPTQYSSIGWTLIPRARCRGRRPVIDLPDAYRRLARDFETRRPGAEAVARLAAGEQLAEIDILVELDADVPRESRPQKRGSSVTTARCRPARRPRRAGDDRHHTAGREVLILTSCSSPDASVSLPTRSIADSRSSRADLRVGEQRWTSDTVVEFECRVARRLQRRTGLPADQDVNMLSLQARKSRQNGTLWTARLKRRFFCLTSCAVAVHAGRGERGDRFAAAALAADR